MIFFGHDTIWVKLKVGCEVWEFNLELKHVRDLETLWAIHSKSKVSQKWPSA